MKLFKNISLGLTAYAEAFKLIRTLRLWTFMAIPFGISLLVTFGISTMAWQTRSMVSTYFKGFWPWTFGADFMADLGGVLGSVGVMLLGFIMTKYLVLALSAPFMSPVAEKIRTYLKPELQPKGGNNFWALLWRGLRLNLGNLVREVGLTLLLLIFSFVPPLVSSLHLFYF